MHGFTKRIGAALLGLLAVALLSFALAPSARHADAQGTRPEYHATGHFDVSSIATVVTGTDSLQTRVRKMYLSSETAGNVRFYDGTPGTWYVGKCNFYLIANTPTEIPDEIAQKIYTSTAGNAIKCQGPGVLSFNIIYTN